MRINSITLLNIRSYLSETIYFSDGINFISGTNGAGKTTIVESIGFALFDAKPDAGKNVTIYDYFVRYGCTSGKISVDFEDNKGTLYTAERKINKRTTSWTIYEKESGMELNLHGSEDVKEFIKERIDADIGQKLEDIFINIIGVSQGTFTTPFMLATADRIKHFNTILNVLEYRKASDNGSKTIKYFNELISRSENQLAEFTGRLSGLEELEEENKTIKTNLKTQNEEYVLSVKVRQNTKETVDNLNALKRDIIEAEKKSRDSQARVLVKGEAIKAQNENLIIASNAKKLVSEYKDGYEAYISAQKSAAELENKKEDRDKLIISKTDTSNKYNLLFKEIENKINIYKNKHENSNEIIKKANAEIEDLKEKLAALSDEHSLNQLKENLKDADDALNLFNELIIEAEKIDIRLKSGAEKWRVNEEQIDKLNEELNQSIDLLNKSKIYEDALNKKEDLKEDIAVVKNNLSIQYGYLSQLNNGICPLCHSDCGDIETLKIKTNELIESFGNKLSDLNAKEEELLKKLEDNKKHYESTIALREKESTLKELINNSKGYIIAFDALKERIASLEFKEVYNQLKVAIGRILELANTKKDLPEFCELQDCKKDPVGLIENTDVFMQHIRNIHKSVADIISEVRGYFNSEVNNSLSKKTDYEKSIERQNDIIAKAQNEIKEINNSIEKGYEFSKAKTLEFNNTLEEIENNLKDFINLDSLLKENKDQLNKNKEDYENYIKNLSIAVKEKEYEDLIKSLKEEITLIQNEIIKNEKNLSQLQKQFSEEDLKKANEDYTQAIEAAAKAQSQYENTKNELEKNEKELKRLYEQKELLDKLKIILENQKRGRVFAKVIFEDVLKNAGERIGGIYRQHLTAKANDMFKEMTNENAELMWEEDYNVIITDYYANEKRQRVFRQLSGGEQMAAALSIRLSFISALTNTKIAFFDEPTTNLDSERRNNLAALLPKVVNDFTQVFVISHDDTFDSVTQNLIKLHKTREGTKNS